LKEILVAFAYLLSIAISIYFGATDQSFLWSVLIAAPIFMFGYLVHKAAFVYSAARSGNYKLIYAFVMGGITTGAVLASIMYGIARVLGSHI
jgi:hypothetical protein